MGAGGDIHLSAEDRKWFVYDLLCKAASENRACPTYTEIAAAMGFRGTSVVTKVFRELRHSGLIVTTREHGNESHVITITATGQTTRKVPPARKLSQSKTKMAQMASLLRQGRAISEIAREVDMSASQVGRTLSAAGLYTPTRTEKPKPILAERPRSWCEQCERLVAAACNWNICGQKLNEQPRQDLAHTGHGVQIVDHYGERH